jgi:hypothetical protein
MRKSKNNADENVSIKEKCMSVINFDFIWIFHEGIEMSQSRYSFKQNLKHVFLSGNDSHLVLRTK